MMSIPRGIVRREGFFINFSVLIVKNKWLLASIDGEMLFAIAGLNGLLICMQGKK